MDHDELLDRIEEIEVSRSETKAEELTALAESLPAGQPGRASALLSAGEHWLYRRAYDEARRCFDAAVADGGQTGLHPTAMLLTLAIETGDEEAVDRFARELREEVKLDRVTATTCHFVGESFEQHDRLREAMRWFTIPLTWGDLETEEPDHLCLAARLRVRRRLGLPTDRLDEIAEADAALGGPPDTDWHPGP